MMTAIRKILELIVFLWASAITPLWVNAIVPLWVKAITPLWVKVKSMKIVERPGDTPETSRLRLELRQSLLKGVGYFLLIIFISQIILPQIPVDGKWDEDPSLFVGIISFLLVPITLVLLATAEFMKVIWLFKMLK